jgi:hypothetical protein
MVAGSKVGVFASRNMLAYTRSVASLIIFEGVSDLIYTYTPLAVGRLNCDSVIPVVEFVKRYSALRQIKIMADNDSPGLSGASRLADGLTGVIVDVRVYVPKKKDWRSHVEAGLGWDQLEVI